MKSSTKKWFITAGILIIIGILIGVVMFAASGFKFSAFAATDNRVKKTHEIDRQDAEHLNLITIASDIILKESADETIKISCYESDKIVFNISQKDGTLKIEEKDNRKWYEFLMPFINVKSTPLIVELPKDGWSDISVSTSSGEIDTDIGFNCRSFSADTTSGDIFLKDISAENQIRLDTTSGEISLKNSEAQTVSAESTSGEIYLSDIKTADSFEVSSTSGDVSVSNAEGISSFSAETTSGDIELQSLTAKSITLNSVSGEIEFLRIDADSYNIDTTSGDVEGTIIGDASSVSFFTDTTSGDVSVPNPSMGDKTFNASTTSGDIDVSFYSKQ